MTTRGALVVATWLVGSPAAAQLVPEAADLPPIATQSTPAAAETRSHDGSTHSLLGETVTRVLKDPTTYALPPIVYTAHRLDWDSSQKLFAHGYLEANPKFTLTGRIDDVPISHQAGKRRILRYSAATIGRSMLNNGISAVVERRLIDRAPEHRKLIRTLGWIERGMVTAYWSYRLTHNQVTQWRDNERVLAGLPQPPSAPLVAQH
jgi:hypothetical protein